MQQLIHAEQLQRFAASYRAGETLFLEGDPTKDLFLLVSGELDILKGPKKISELSEKGSLFGEMSFLLDEPRTATIRAKTDVEVIRIPGDRISELSRDLPDFGLELARILAGRLQSTTTMAYGLKEFCDQLPDAVMITTDKDQRILAWNAAAERLYGRSGEQMRDLPLRDIYADDEAYEQFQNELQHGRPAESREMPVQLPDGQNRFVATSTTLLYDGHFNIQGLLFLGRDVTRIHELENRYRKIRNWLIPALALIGILLVVLFAVLPHFDRGAMILDYKQQSFIERIRQDVTTLSAELKEADDPQAVTGVMKEYFTYGEPQRFGISGLLLLDRDKSVLAAYSPSDSEAASRLPGSSYGALQLNEDPKQPVSILTLFRTTQDNPTGSRAREIAWQLDRPGLRGWLVFQLNEQLLDKEFGLDAETLKELRFRD